MPSPAKTTKRRGRRQGEPVSREAVLSAAKPRFATAGYAKASMRAMLQSATSNSDAHDAFRSFMQNYVLTAVSGVLGGGEQARLRAMLAASQLVGMAILRYIIEVPPLATLPADEVVALIAPTVTRYLTADASELGLRGL